MTHALHDRSIDEPAAPVPHDAPAELADFLRHHPTATTRLQLVDDDGADATVVVVPSQALELFIEILDHLKDGNAVSVVPANADLTTQQAADMIGVSRPFLIDKILEPVGPVPFRMVGHHRRIRLSDLETYRREDALRRKRAADRVTRLAIDGGLDD